jgi:hypothetical protein
MHKIIVGQHVQRHLGGDVLQRFILKKSPIVLKSGASRRAS